MDQRLAVDGDVDIEVAHIQAVAAAMDAGHTVRGSVGPAIECGTWRWLRGDGPGQDGTPDDGGEADGDGHEQNGPEDG
jgi:hypothetical protein